MENGFRHEALLYAGQFDFVSRVSSFVQDGLSAGEPILVLVPGWKIDALRSALGDGVDGVLFSDMAEAGRNPGRVISIWRDFFDDHASARRIRGVGEPIYAARTSEELAECERHEALLNVAFAGAPLWLVCPYDTETMPPVVIDEAKRNHPAPSDGGVPSPRPGVGMPDVSRVLDGQLPEPPTPVVELIFDADTLGGVRNVVSTMAAASGLRRERIEELVLAVNEVATNSVCHGGGAGLLRAWSTNEAITCEIRDGGRIADPLVGRMRPDPTAVGGFGLWLANQLCDLLQIRSCPEGSVVRLHVSLADSRLPAESPVLVH